MIHQLLLHSMAKILERTSLKKKWCNPSVGFMVSEITAHPGSGAFAEWLCSSRSVRQLLLHPDGSGSRDRLSKAVHI